MTEKLKQAKQKNGSGPSKIHISSPCCGPGGGLGGPGGGFGFLVVFEGPGPFREVRGTGRIDFHLVLSQFEHVENVEKQLSGTYLSGPVLVVLVVVWVVLAVVLEVVASHHCYQY